MGFALGVDVANVDDVADSVERFGNKYLRRLFTEHELDSCAGDDTVRNRSLAARFAAKEAAMKALVPTSSDVILWRDIEVRKTPTGHCELRLHDRALELAQRNRVTDLAVSFTHEGNRATAVVVGWRREEDR